jgi:hypothetical protein
MINEYGTVRGKRTGRGSLAPVQKAAGISTRHTLKDSKGKAHEKAGVAENHCLQQLQWNSQAHM